MKFPNLLLVIALALIVSSVPTPCPQLCLSSCDSGTTCATCYSDFSADSQNVTSCSMCPSGMFFDSDSGLCDLCPIDCLTCSSKDVCSKCIEGYELSNAYECTPQRQTTIGWVSKNASHELHLHSPNKYNNLVAIEDGIIIPATLSTSIIDSF